MEFDLCNWEYIPFDLFIGYKSFDFGSFLAYDKKSRSLVVN